MHLESTTRTASPLSDQQIAELFVEHEKYLRRTAWRRLDLYNAPPVMIDDSVASAFEHLLTRSHEGEIIDNPIAFLVAHTKWAAFRLAVLNGRYNHPRFPTAEPNSEKLENVAISALFESAIVRDLILNGLRELAPRQREIFLRSEIRGDTWQEIADDLGLSKNTVHFNLYCARNRMAEFMETGQRLSASQMVKGNRAGHRATRNQRQPKPRKITKGHAMQLAAARAVLAARRKQAREERDVHSVRTELLNA